MLGTTGAGGSSMARLAGRTFLVLAIAAIIAACGGPGAGTPNPPAATNPPASAEAGVTLELRTDATLGDYVAGADGLALYIFTPDTGGTSVCTGDCAASWPPLTVSSAADVTAGAGVTGDIGTITRDDGSLQVTLGGAPLYYFAGDAQAGDVNGQGLNDVWYLATASGGGIGVDGSGGGGAGGTAPSPTVCSGRYCY